MSELFDYIKEKGGFISTREIKSRPIYLKLLDSAKKGKLIRVRRGVYALEESFANIMFDVDKLIPSGVVCMYSAWSHYGISTQVPLEYHIAVPKNKKLTLPDYPPVSLHRWTDNTYNTGITTANIGGYNVMIYDLEKCVCDAIKFRNKVGQDVASEILKLYLKRHDCNISKLMSYAKILRVEKTIKGYLDFEL
mgnify:CR=1 FL=1